MVSLSNSLRNNPTSSELENQISSFDWKSWFKKNWKILGFLVLLVCLAYINSLNNDFVSDDLTAILKNEELGKISYVLNRPTAFLGPLFYFTINKIFGQIPIYYRLINFSFHLGTVLITYILLCILLDSKAAFFAASIFAVHPVLSEAVSWISGGAYSQSSFFIILSLLAYILAIKNKKFLFVSVAGFMLSLFSSGMAVVFPLMVLMFVISFGGIRKNYKSLIPFLVIGIMWGAIYLGKIGERMAVLKAVYYQEHQILNPLLQIPVAVTSYLELIFWPKLLTLYHSEMTFSLRQYFIRLGVFIIFLGIIVYGYMRSRRIFFWLSFFIIGLLPTLTPLGISWIVAERYVYLGSLGIFAVVALGIKQVSGIKKLKIISYIIFSLIIIALCARTILRNIDWKNEDNLWIATAKTSPSSPNAHNNLGDVYSRHKNLDKAAQEFKKAIQIKPNYADAYHNLADTYRQMGKFKEAIQYYQRAIHFNPNLWQSYQNLAAICFRGRRIDLAKEYLRQAIKINPKNSILHSNLGVVYLVENEKLKAREEFKQALQLDPSNKIAKQNLSALDLR